MTSKLSKKHAIASKNAGNRNALKHGFAARFRVQDDSERVSKLTAILKEGLDDAQFSAAAKRAAAARSYLEQVVRARDKLLGVICETSQRTEGSEANRSGKLEAFYKQLSRLERYEKEATVRWERAVAVLETAQIK